MGAGDARLGHGIVLLFQFRSVQSIAFISCTRALCSVGGRLFVSACGACTDAADHRCNQRPVSPPCTHSGGTRPWIAFASPLPDTNLPTVGPSTSSPPSQETIQAGVAARGRAASSVLVLLAAAVSDFYIPRDEMARPPSRAPRLLLSSPRPQPCRGKCRDIAISGHRMMCIRESYWREGAAAAEGGGGNPGGGAPRGAPTQFKRPEPRQQVAEGRRGSSRNRSYRRVEFLRTVSWMKSSFVHPRSYNICFDSCHALF